MEDRGVPWIGGYYPTNGKVCQARACVLYWPASREVEPSIHGVVAGGPGPSIWPAASIAESICVEQGGLRMPHRSKPVLPGSWRKAVVLMLVVTMLALSLVLVGCRRGEKTPTPMPGKEQIQEKGYPAPRAKPTDTSGGPYPPPRPTATALPAGYPSPTP